MTHYQTPTTSKRLDSLQKRFVFKCLDRYIALNRRAISQDLKNSIIA